jgi:hypothetical protein
METTNSTLEKIMPFWDREPFPDIIKEDYCSFFDTGPLLSPIDRFKLFRTKKLELTLETVGGKEAIAQGALRRTDRASSLNNQEAVLKDISGMPIYLKGVITLNAQTTENYRKNFHEISETAQLYSIEGEIPREQPPTYTIDWLENLRHFYFWPQLVKNDRDTAFARAYGRDPDALTLDDKAGEHSTGFGALKLRLGGIDIYLTVNKAKEGTEQIEPGYILYMGLPDEDERRKIRTCLSFALGIYLVHLGHSTYTADWKVKSFRAVEGYSMDMRAFDIHVQPPAWLGTKSHNQLDITKVTRLISGLYAHYEELDFDNLNWGYWHAITVPPHIKAVHYGAIIEALQRNYLDAHQKEFSESVVPDRESWKKLKASVTNAINGETLTSGQKELLLANVGRLNQTPRADVTDQVLQRLNLVLGDDERKAWQRRHDAAHGNPMVSGREQEVIRDTHLLHVIFNRMVLRIVNGSDDYYDYSSKPEDFFAIRPLNEPAPSISKPP